MKLHVWRIDYCLAGKERTNSNYQKEDPIRVLHIQSGTQENVMDYQMTLVTKGGKSV